jgi:phosphorylcholine metabolism protein LicD
MLSNICLSSLSPYINEIIGNHQKEHELFIDFMKAFYFVRREVLYSVLREIRLIKICLNETYSKAIISKHLSDSFPIQNGLKQGDASSPVLFNFALEYAIRKVQENLMGLKLRGTHQLLAYADDTSVMGDNIDAIKKNLETLMMLVRRLV